MIPLVYRTLMQAVEAEGLNVQYMRIPAEPMRPFVYRGGLWRTYSAINVVKQIVLKGCWLLIKPDFKLARQGGNGILRNTVFRAHG